MSFPRLLPPTFTFMCVADPSRATSLSAQLSVATSWLLFLCLLQDSVKSHSISDLTHVALLSF